MFSVTIAGEGEAALEKISTLLRGRRFRVDTLPASRSGDRRSTSDALVVVSDSYDRSRTTRLVLDARRDDDVRRLPFCLVARAIEPSTARAYGARALIRFDGDLEDLVIELRRMLVRDHEAGARIHQLEGEIGSLRIGELLGTLASSRRDAVVRVQRGVERGVVAVRDGKIVSAIFEAEDGRAALRTLLALQDGRFRVELRTPEETDEFGALDVEAARALLDDAELPRSSVSRGRDDGRSGRGVEDRAPDVDASAAALAAAVMNAIAAAARVTMPETVVGRELEAARLEALATAPAMRGFRIAAGAVVVVDQLSTAAAAGGGPLGLWIARALARFEARRPGRFDAAALDRLLGGLGPLVTQFGWRAAIEDAVSSANREGGTR
jgi:hypothetical protein